MQALPLLSILAGVAVTRAIRKTTGLDPRIKWPNDVLIDGKKVAGILAESVVTGNTVSHAVVGIGINVGLDTDAVEDIASFATGLNVVAERPVPREDVLRQLLHDLDALYLGVGQGGSPMGEWRALLETLGQRVQAHWRGDSCVGLAEDVDELGNLQLRLEDGRLVTLSAGDVTLRGPEP